MRCLSSDTSPSAQYYGHGRRERCLFTSVMMLGGLFGLMASPAARAPMMSIFVIVGVQVMTFAIAAPSRLGLFREVGLLIRGLESFGLATLCAVLGRGTDARAVLLRQRVRAENAYASDPQLAAVVAADPLRLHHIRRIASLGALLAIVAANALPLLRPETYTWGNDWTAPFVFLLDVLVIGLATRLITERMGIRLLEATHALGGGNPIRGADPGGSALDDARRRDGRCRLARRSGGGRGRVGGRDLVDRRRISWSQPAGFTLRRQRTPCPSASASARSWVRRAGLAHPPATES